MGRISLYKFYFMNNNSKITELQNQIKSLEQNVKTLESNQFIFETLLKSSVESVGQDFFEKITISLSKWLNAECVIIGQIIDNNKVKVSPMYLDGKIDYDFIYDLTGSPCDLAIKKNYCSYTHDIINLFPKDTDLVDLKAQGYIGTALYNEKGIPNGILCAISRNKLQLPPNVENVFKLIGTRITAEIEHKKEQEKLHETKNQLEQKNKELRKVSKELNETNKKLKLREEHFRLIAETASDADWLYNVTLGKFTYISSSIYNLIGYTVEEAFKLTIDESYTKESAANIKELISLHSKELINKGKLDKPFINEFQQYCKNGDIIWVEITTKYQFNSKGEVEIIGISRDITQRKIQEEELRLMGIKLDKAQKIASVGFFEWFKDTDIVSGSDEYFNIWETTPDKHNCFNHFIESVIPEDREKVHKALEYGVIKKQFYDVEYRIKVGENLLKYIHAIGEFNFDQNGNAIYLLGMVHDITKQKEAENKIKDREQHLRTIFNGSQVGIILHKNRKLIFANQYIIDLLGYKFENTVKNDLSLAYPSLEESNKVRKKIYEGLNKSNSVLQEIRLKTKNSKILNMLLSSSYYNLKDDTDGIISVLTNITKLKKIENELKKANNEKNKFFSIIAHDIRGPLGSIMSLADLLSKKLLEFDDERKLEFISNISSGINKTFKLLENLLTWSRSQLGKIEYNKEKININEMINETASYMQDLIKNKEIKLNLEIDKNLYIYADKTTIETVIRNLLSNAIKYVFRNGEISIQASKITSNSSGSNIEISISNNGKDIPKEILTKLFKIDENITTVGTENEQGTGLGLILCKEFVENNNGEIWVESEKGKGAIFRFTLPEYKTKNDNQPY